MLFVALREQCWFLPPLLLSLSFIILHSPSLSVCCMLLCTSRPGSLHVDSGCRSRKCVAEELKGFSPKQFPKPDSYDYMGFGSHTYACGEARRVLFPLLLLSSLPRGCTWTADAARESGTQGFKPKTTPMDTCGFWQPRLSCSSGGAWRRAKAAGLGRPGMTKAPCGTPEPRKHT